MKIFLLALTVFLANGVIAEAKIITPECQKKVDDCNKKCKGFAECSGCTLMWLDGCS